MSDLPQWFAEQGVEVVCSLPHFRQPHTDQQRGDGTFERSLEALHRLNAAGYGQGNPKRKLTLVSNPAEATLSCNQAALLEQMWKQGLKENHNITFDRLIAINNMPISRHLEWLEQSGNLQAYMELLVNSFNPATVSGLMCRHTISTILVRQMKMLGAERTKLKGLYLLMIKKCSRFSKNIIQGLN
jgi:radical SAM/Cys-rich protein